MKYLQEGNCKTEIKRALKPVVLGMGSQGNAPKMENQQLVSPSRKCSSTPVGFGQDFLANNNVTTMEHPPYSPDLSSAILYLFPRLKSALKGRRFYDDTDIIQNATKELKSFTNFLPGIFPTLLQSLAEVYTCTRELFEENVV